MSRFIPQTTIPVFPVDQDQPDPGALRARIYAETPVWVLERITSAADTAREVYGADVQVIQVFAVQVAIGLISLHGDGSPDSEAFPPYCRDAGDTDALGTRAAWLCSNLSTRAIQRLLRELTDRAVLPVGVEGN